MIVELVGTVVSVLKRLVVALLLVSFLFVGCFSLVGGSSRVAVTYSIDLENFRWTRFPLKVFVELNQWAVPNYAFAVREALDNWTKAVWNYTQSFNDTSVSMINYVFYLDGFNSTSDYDVYIAFAPDNMPPGSNTVGLTSYGVVGHEPVSPIVVNITTFSRSVPYPFVRDVAMHEFGHVLGLGHAVPSDTELNGPELMYYISSKTEDVSPSTLDVYGLTVLYSGNFVASVDLPEGMPYMMLAKGVVPPPPATSVLDDYKQYVPIIAVLDFLVGVAVILGEVTRERRPEGGDLESSQPAG